MGPHVFMASASGTKPSLLPATDISETHRNVHVFSVAIFSGGKVETEKKNVEQEAKSCTLNDTPRFEESARATVSTLW